jgi:hypothetical protein
MPYAIGLQAASAAFLSAGLSAHLSLALVVLVAILCIIITYEKDHEDAAPHLPFNSLFAIWPFFRRRFDFINLAFDLTKETVFQFRLLQVKPVFASC